MDRRGFLGSILALAAAPAIVRADSPMRIVPRGALLLEADVDLEIGRMMRADLADVIYCLTPLDSPFVSVMSNRQELIVHEWTLDALN